MKKINYETNSAYRLFSRLFGEEKAKDLINKAIYLDGHTVKGFTFLDVTHDISIDDLKKNTIHKKREYSLETLEKRYAKALERLKEKYNK